MRPDFLLMAPIPKPMHGTAPRLVLGEEWWAAEKGKAMRAWGFRCAACGCTADRAWHQPGLECHERYRFNFETGRMTYIETVPMCYGCHAFVHFGRVRAQMRAGKITREHMRAIRSRGRRILHRAKLPTAAPVITAYQPDWTAWRLVVAGVEYPGRFRSQAEYDANYGGV